MLFKFLDMKDLKEYIRTIPDFPIKGIQFRDITTLIQNAEGFHLAIDKMCDMVKHLDYDVIIGAESRGFVFSAPMAYNQNKSLVLIRKKGKLPGKTVSQSFDLEYGSATIEMHTDSFKPGTKVLVVDDLLATGGTLEAMIKLVEKQGGIVVGACVFIELPDLKGRDRLKSYPVFSAVTFEGE